VKHYLVIIALVASWLTSCNSQGPYPVEGLVLLDGEPLDAAEVVFEPVSRPPGQPSLAYTGPDGRFKLSTALGDGALRGEFKVIIRKIVGPPIPRGPLGRGATPAQIAERQQAYAEAVRAQTSVTPAIYGTFEDTPLRCKVPLERPLIIELDRARAAEKPFVHPEMSLIK
jgi:hypothetical protein